MKRPGTRKTWTQLVQPVNQVKQGPQKRTRKKLWGTHTETKRVGGKRRNHNFGDSLFPHSMAEVICKKNPKRGKGKQKGGYKR